MSNLELYKDVWVITLADPAANIYEEGTVISVFESEEAAKNRYEEIMNDDEKDEHVKIFIEPARMHLDIKAFKVMA
jgi:hypothetical protein